MITVFHPASNSKFQKKINFLGVFIFVWLFQGHNFFTIRDLQTLKKKVPLPEISQFQSGRSLFFSPEKPIGEVEPKILSVATLFAPWSGWMFGTTSGKRYSWSLGNATLSEIEMKNKLLVFSASCRGLANPPWTNEVGIEKSYCNSHVIWVICALNTLYHALVAIFCIHIFLRSFMGT